MFPACTLEMLGGGSGIRTHDTVARIHAFQACAFSHSAIPPVTGAAANIVGARSLASVTNYTLRSGSDIPLGRNFLGLEMGVLRFLASVLLLVAVIAAIYDGTRALESRGGEFIMTSLGEQWSKVAPISHKNAQAAVRRYTHPFVWDGLIQRLLLLPTWAVFGSLGLITAYAGRRRRRVNVFVN
jgi:hypothetical protein